MAMAVLPVLRSPMISSRWPRPIGDHGVDGLDAGLERLVHRLPAGDAGGGRLDGPGQVGEDRPLVVDRLAQRIDHAADQGVADGHPQELAGGRDGVALFDLACSRPG